MEFDPFFLYPETSLSACFFKNSVAVLVNFGRYSESYFLTWAQTKVASQNLLLLLIYILLMGSSILDRDFYLCSPTEIFPVCVTSTRRELRALGMLEQGCNCFEVHLFDWGNFSSIFKRCDNVAQGSDSTYGSIFLHLLIEKENTAVFLWSERYFLIF